MMMVLIMKKYDKSFIENLYPVGTIVELVCMDDVQAPDKGTRGVVKSIDDIGQIHVEWENGCGLALIYGVDDFIVID